MHILKLINDRIVDLIEKLDRGFRPMLDHAIRIDGIKEVIRTINPISVDQIVVLIQQTNRGD